MLIKTIKLTVSVCVAVACGAAATAALAAPVPGATYEARTAGGAYVVFTVSADGREVTSYEITGVVGDTCQFSAEGTRPSFPGAAIRNNAFSYGFGGQAFSFKGKFPGPRSASGSFHFHNDAVGTAKACDSGIVQWTATAKGQSYATRVSLSQVAGARLGGRVTSKHASCVASRAVTLWLGRQKIHSTVSTRNGSYGFARTALVRGRRVHVTVAVRSVQSAVCRAASSHTVGA
jgi:hypothetical protein